MIRRGFSALRRFVARLLPINNLGAPRHAPPPPPQQACRIVRHIRTRRADKMEYAARGESQIWRRYKERYTP